MEKKLKKKMEMLRQQQTPLMFSRTPLKFEAKRGGFDGSAGVAAITDRDSRPGGLAVVTETNGSGLGVPFFQDGGIYGITQINFGNIPTGAVIFRGQKTLKCLIVPERQGQKGAVSQVFDGDGVIGHRSGKAVRGNGVFGGRGAAGYGCGQQAHDDNNRWKQ